MLRRASVQSAEELDAGEPQLVKLLIGRCLR